MLGWRALCCTSIRDAQAGDNCGMAVGQNTLGACVHSARQVDGDQEERLLVRFAERPVSLVGLLHVRQC